jgi:drug/metabolite transporter (DMT)-like permease
MNHNVRIGFLLAVIGTALFALKSIFIKFAYQTGIDTTTLLALRMLLALPFYVGVLVWLLYQDTRPPLNTKTLMQVLLLGFLGYYLASFLDMEGLHHISAQLERLTLYSYPVITTLLGWLWLREQITSRVVLALVLASAGVLLLYIQEAMNNTNNATLGVLLVAGAALSFSVYVVLGKPLIQKLGSRQFTAIAMIGSTMFVSIHFASTHELTTLTAYPEAWTYALLLAFVSTVLPSFMVSEAIARIGAARTSIVGTIGPVLTILLAAELLHEPLGMWQIAGIGLTLFGVSLLRKS